MNPRLLHDYVNDQTITVQEHIDHMLVVSYALGVGFTDEFSIRIAGFGGASEVYHPLPHFLADPMGWWRHIFGLAPHLYRNTPVLQGNVAAEVTTGVQTVFLPFFTWMAKVCKGHGAALNMVFSGLGTLIIGGGCLMTGILARCDMSSNGERTAVRQFSPTAPLLPGQQVVDLRAISINDMTGGMDPHFQNFVMMRLNNITGHFEYPDELVTLPRVFGNKVTSDLLNYRAEFRTIRTHDFDDNQLSSEC
jgi:hypothetical protein